MCTVTFIPVNKTVFITHNRDENRLRPKAEPPAFAKLKGTGLLYPKDGEAGGSWVGLNEYGHAAVLLNGAFKKHIPQPPYRKSRGLIVLDLLASSDLLHAYETIDLGNIEPFTVILWNGRELFECRWDAERKHIIELDAAAAHIWSSSTLYDENTRRKRLSWFREWQQKNPHPDLRQILNFHMNGGDGDATNDLKMSRSNNLATLSITVIESGRYAARMKYIELSDMHTSENSISFKKAVAESR